MEQISPSFSESNQRPHEPEGVDMIVGGGVDWRGVDWGCYKREVKVVEQVSLTFSESNQPSTGVIWGGELRGVDGV